MGAHVWFPAYLRDHLLPSWRVAGWSPDWFAGFPAGQFYFPLPALLVGRCSTSSCPYNVAFKLVTALGPGRCCRSSAYGLGRGLKVRRPGPELFAVATTLFLFFKGVSAAAGHATTRRSSSTSGSWADRSSARWRGSTRSRWRSRSGSPSSARSRTRCASRRRLWLPAVLLAATVLCHIVVGIFVVLGALVVWLFHRPVRTFTRRGCDRRSSAGCSPRSGRVPLLATFGYTANMRYEKLTWYLDYLFPGELWWVVALAAIGAVIGLVRRDRAVLTLLTITGRRSPSCSGSGPSCTRGTCASCRSGTSDCSCSPASGVAEIVRGIAQQVGARLARPRRPSRATTGRSIRSWTAAGSGW